MSPQNLTNVYNQNPTLQGQYTLQQYLDLFGQGSYTPIQPTPTTTGDPNPTLIQPKQGIINQNINQFQNQGGGGEGDGNNTIGGKDYGYKSSFASTATTPEENENFLNDIGEGTIDDDDMPGFDLKGLGAFFSNLPTPFNLAKKGMKAFNDYQEKKAKEREIELQKEIEAANLKAAIDAAEAERVAGVQSSLNEGSYVDRDSSGMSASDQQVGGGAGVAGLGSSATDRGSKSHQGYSQHAKGGRVRKRGSYFDGGIVSLRRR